MNIEHIKNIANSKRLVEVAALQLEDCDNTSSTCFNAFGNQVQHQNPPDSRMLGIIDRRDRLRGNLLKRYEEYLRAVKWGMDELESVADAKMRKILYLRYVKEEQWSKIATEIGGKATSDSIKKSVERFLEQKSSVKPA